MNHVLTLVANRSAMALSPSVIACARDAVAGDTPVVLSENEAVDIPVVAAPDMDAVRAALDGAPIDALVTAAASRRKGLLIADMDSTIVAGEPLDDLADFAGLKARIAAI